MEFIVTPAGQTIALVSFGIVLLSTIIRYFTVDRDKLKESRQRLKEHQEKMKEAQKKGDSKSMQKHQHDMLAETMENMRQSMKPMIFTMIPILLIFGWMRGTYGDYGTAFDVKLIESHPEDVVVLSVSQNGEILKEAGRVEWSLGNITAGKDGTASANVTVTGASKTQVQEKLADTVFTLTYTSKDNQSHAFSGKIIDEDSILTVARPGLTQTGDRFNYELKLHNQEFMVKIGSYTFGWLGWYIIISFATSIILNKAFKLT
ncbi:MAG: EMC3/TMCO1 family protein [Candidatus Altiarchaeota archaeon]